MMGTVIFRTAGENADERLIREYVFDAVDRLPDQAGCDGVAFNPFARKAGLAEIDIDSGVLVRIWGDTIDAVVDDERKHWDALVEDGVVRSWEWSDDDTTLTDYMGDKGAERYLQYHGLATRLSKLVYEEFEKPPDPVDEYPGEERRAPAGVGWWRLLHLLTIQQNYRYGEEIDAFAEGIRSTLHTLAQFDDRERAIDETDAVIASLEALRAELEDE